jgi:nucleoside-diphosphate-sugar epimerase
MSQLLEISPMLNKKIIACVTGGTGIIGRHIVNLLLRRGYEVRILSRKEHHHSEGGAVFFHGNMEKKESMVNFLKGARLLFHCAGEKKDERKMRAINVHGTEQLVSLLKGSDIEYFCHISSAGVIGETDLKWVDESTPCRPQNFYEISNRDAELVVLQGVSGCRIVILRPTNVVADEEPGTLRLLMRSSGPDHLRIFLKGGECAHIVHAEDVAHAAVHLISYPRDAPACFFVSCDHEQLNTYAGLWSLYRVLEQGKPIEEIEPAPHLPLVFPYVLRKLWRGKGNYGDVRYSSAKLLATGFQFPLGIEGAVRRLAASRPTVTS